MSTEQARSLVERFLLGSDAEFGPYEAPDLDGEPVMHSVFPKRLYRTQLVDARELDVDVQVFLGLQDLGGLLWEQDVRALMRITPSAQTALPTILDGGYISAERTDPVAAVGGMAFVATRGGARPFSSADLKHFHADPQAAFGEFRALVHALAELHFVGITHRSISPKTIDVHVEGGRRTVRLARYELSALTTDLFRTAVDSSASSAELRSLLLPATESYYLPPERIAFLLAGDVDLVEESGSDIFALGAVAAEWFLGSYTEHDELQPARADPEVTAVEAVNQQIRYAMHLQSLLRQTTSIPADLAEIIAMMLSPHAEDRPAADLVLGELAGAFDRIQTAFAGPEETQPHLLVYMAGESTRTIHHWGLIDHRPDSEVGQEELEALIREDLRGAFFTDSPLGAAPFVSGDNTEALRSSRVIIKGDRLAWFCDYYRAKDEEGGLEAPTDRALIIRFVARLDIAAVRRRLETLDWTAARRMPDIDLREMGISPRRMKALVAKSPSWRSRVESTRRKRQESGAEMDFRDAIDWLIEYQEVELAARAYPFVRTEEESGREVVVRYDSRTDDRRVVASPMFVKYALSPALRPEFGAFFGSLESADGDADVDVIEDNHGRPGRRRITTAQVVRSEGRDRIRLRFQSMRPDLPQRAWLRPSDDRGTGVGIDRQRNAALELYGAMHLQSQLRAPKAIRTFEERWKHAGEHLEGNGPEVVRDMLVCEPFMAIQGPPGTGKTTVAAAAVKAYLDHDPGARVLVSAQSNFALDNLAAAILRELGEMDAAGRPVEDRQVAEADPDSTVRRPVALRVTTGAVGAVDRVAPRVQPWQRLQAAGRLARQMLLRATPAAGVEEALRKVLEQWRVMLGREGESIVPELADRLARGANLVFATCSASTPNIVSPTADAVFDWVIVEEAAKAWPTEIAMPLLRGRRWTLLGDHFQLPAHRREDLRRFLRACAADPNEEMEHITPQRAAAFERTFDLFGNLFANGGTDAAVDTGSPRAASLARRSATRTLGTQFRMREPLGELVSRVFYPRTGYPVVPGQLPEGRVSSYYSGQTRDDIPPLQLNSPPELSGHSLVWLDTAGVSACRDEPHWWNPGEVAVVLKLLERLDPSPVPNRNGYGANPIAVLTPYREQAQQLRASSLAAPYVSTVHAFQGREADLVIVSLVRDSSHGHGLTRIRSGLGHLAQRELVNVLFSRARRKMVIVGRFDHYASIMGESELWSRVCLAVDLYGVRRYVTDLFGDLPALVEPRFELATSERQASE